MSNMRAPNTCNTLIGTTHVHMHIYTYTHTHTHTHITQNNDIPPLEDPSLDVVYGPQPRPDSYTTDPEISMQANPSNVDFPLDHLSRLDDQLGRPKWVVPVRPDDDLERLLRASIKLCREGEFECHLICIHVLDLLTIL